MRNVGSIVLRSIGLASLLAAAPAQAQDGAASVSLAQFALNRAPAALRLAPYPGPAGMQSTQSSGQSSQSSSSSQQVDKRTVKFGVGLFLPSGLPGLKASTGLDLNMQLMKPGKLGDLVLSFDILGYSASDDSTGNSGTDIILPLMVSYDFHVGPNFYVGPGIGYAYDGGVISDNQGDSVQTETSYFVWSIAGGANYRSMYAELRYLGGSVDVNGFTLVIGGRF